MKFFLLAISFLVSSLGQYTAGETLFVIANTVSLYAAPNFDSEQVLTLKKNDEVVFISEEENGFLKVEAEGVEGYVYSEVVGKELPEQQVILSYNATIINKTDIIDQFSGEVICTVEPGKRIFLYEGYDTEKKYLAVQLEQNGDIIFGLVDINAVKPDGVNVALIVSLSAIVGIVSIMIILLGITKKKRHKRLQMED